MVLLRGVIKLLLSGMLVYSSIVLGQLPQECGSLHNAYGPFDYTNPADNPSKLNIVEAYHFNLNVELLVKGMTSRIMEDIDYVLRAFPNHHRALNSAAKHAIELGPPEKTGGNYTIECYFERAKAFAPRDSVVLLIEGNYFFKSKQYKAAEKSYLNSIRLNEGNIESHYNLGLLYVKLGNIEKAKVHADKAYLLGYPLDGLKNLILEAKKNK